MNVRIGTAEHDSTFHSQGLALKRLLEDALPSASVDVLTSAAASVENANRLHSGDIDLGFMASNWISRAAAGTSPFEAPIALRMVAPMNAGPLFFITRADSALRSVADLRGRRIAVGPSGSGMRQHAASIFDALGPDFSDIEPHFLDFAAGAAALESGAVDAQLQCPIPNKVMNQLSARADIRVLSYADGQLERVLDRVPYYRRTVMRRGTLRGLDDDVAQLAVVNVLVCHARAQDERIAAVTRTIVCGARRLERLNSLFAGMEQLFAPALERDYTALEYERVPLHPGARQAYAEVDVAAG